MYHNLEAHLICISQLFYSIEQDMNVECERLADQAITRFKDLDFIGPEQAHYPWFRY
jgi:hypothetical protein